MNDVIIECFKEASETLNFTTAANNVHISQPSFSRNIAVFEEELGFKLFWRSKQNGIRLTPAGAAMYNGIIELDKTFKGLVDMARRINRGEEGKLVIGILNGICVDSMTFYHIKRFQELYPDLEVVLKSCTLSDLEEDLIRGTTDVCFMMANIIKNTEEILYEKVFSIPSYFAVPRSMGLDTSKEHDITELKDEYFLLTEGYPSINENVIRMCRENGFAPKVKVAPDNETKMLWADMGEGVAGVTQDLYINKSQHTDLIKIKGMNNMDFSICWHKYNYNPAIALFYSLSDEVAELLPDYIEETEKNEKR